MSKKEVCYNGVIGKKKAGCYVIMLQETRDMTRTDLCLATGISGDKGTYSVSPVLPPDIMGVYVYLPEFNA